jgi:translation initiation factor 4A
MEMNEEENIQTESMIEENPISESDIKPIENWDELDIKPELLRGIFAYGFEKPSEIQKKSIPAIISGRDVIAQAQIRYG